MSDFAPKTITVEFQEYELAYVLAALRLLGDKHPESGPRKTANEPDHGKRIRFIARSIQRQAARGGVVDSLRRAYTKVDHIYWMSR